MAVLHITESELARDVHGVLEKVRGGTEVVIEDNNRPVAVIKPPQVKGRKMSEVMAAMEASGANATVDEDFARDVEAAHGPGRSINECIAIAKEREKGRGYAVTLDPDFAADVEEIVRNRQPWNPPSWD